MPSLAMPPWLVRHRFGVLLGGLLLVVFVLPAFQGEAALRRGAGVIGLGMPIFGVVAATESRRHLAVAAGLALVSAGATAGTTSYTLSTGSFEASLLFIGFTTYVVFASVLRAPRVTGDVLAGALAAFLLLGLAWALVFGLLESFRPGSFSVPAGSESGQLRFPDLVYFSYVTLMTIGYGDMSAVATSARLLAILEGFTGVAFNTVVLAVLVAKYLAHAGGRT
jgi:hypothetical protein